MVQDVLNVAGIAVFASSGAVAALRAGLDLFGVVTLAIVTGVGGGIVRDVLLGRVPPESVTEWLPIAVAAVAGLLTVLLLSALERLSRPVLVLDAVGMGFFASSGAAVAVGAGAGPFTACLMGVVTAVTGGLLRDVLVNEVPLILRRDLYAIPALLGALAFVLVQQTGPGWLALVVGTTVATGLRLVAIARGWQLPAGRPA